MSDLIICSYCGAEVSAAEVEKEGGACPECGAMLSGPSVFDSYDEDEMYEEEEFGEMVDEDEDDE